MERAGWTTWDDEWREALREASVNIASSLQRDIREREAASADFAAWELEQAAWWDGGCK
jgi:hypothetical protein